MAIKSDGDTITFSSGRTVYANCGIVGISHEPKFNEEYYEIYEGYDGTIFWPDLDEGDPKSVTNADMVELAEMMIERWKSFRALVLGHKAPIDIEDEPL
jgi:hypothetical protein